MSIENSPLIRGLKLIADMNQQGSLLATVDGITLEKLEAIPPGANPFHYDSYHMGMNLGDMTLMYSDSRPEYVIFVMPNGNRIKISFDKKYLQKE